MRANCRSLNVFGPKLSIPIPIFCKTDMFCSIHSASRGGKLKCLGNQQLLRRDPLLFHATSQFFEQNPLMRRVLINQHEAVGVFHQHVKFVQHADDLELLLGAIRSRL